MIKKILIGLIVIAVILGVVAGIWLYSNNYFYKVTVLEKKLGPLTFVYTSRKGDYSKMGPDMDMFCSKLMKAYNVDPSKGMAFFYDDPKTTKPEDLRSDIGFLLEGSDASKMETIMKTTKVKWIGQKDYVVASFPLKGNISYMIGAIKCYPALAKHIQAKGYKTGQSFEIYDMTAKQIMYGFQIVR